MSDESFTTTDFYITAVMIATKHDVIKVTKEGTNNRIKRFHFKYTDDIDATILSFMNGTLQGSIRDFKNAIESLKDLIFSS